MNSCMELRKVFFSFCNTVGVHITYVTYKNIIRNRVDYLLSLILILGQYGTHKNEKATHTKRRRIVFSSLNE